MHARALHSRKEQERETGISSNSSLSFKLLTRHIIFFPLLLFLFLASSHSFFFISLSPPEYRAKHIIRAGCSSDIRSRDRTLFREDGAYFKSGETRARITDRGRAVAGVASGLFIYIIGQRRTPSRDVPCAAIPFFLRQCRKFA